MSAVATEARAPRAPRDPGHKATCNRQIEAGISTALEFAFLFLQWAEQLTVPLTWELIAQRYGCSRATAYRWRSAYLAFRERQVQP